MAVPGPSTTAESGRAFDFEQMLQQNLEDATLPDQESEAEDTPPAQLPKSTIQMDKSVRMFGVRKSEGRPEGPSDSLLYR